MATPGPTRVGWGYRALAVLACWLSYELLGRFDWSRTFAESSGPGLFLAVLTWLVLPVAIGGFLALLGERRLRPHARSAAPAALVSALLAQHLAMAAHMLPARGMDAGVALLVAVFVHAVFLIPYLIVLEQFLDCRKPGTRART